MVRTEQGVEANQHLMQRYFEVMGADGDFERFFTEDVTWTNAESGATFSGRAAVREYLLALHTTMFDARPEGRALSVTEDHAFLEGEFVGTSGEVRAPFCLVYDLGEAGISAMRLYMAFAALPPRTST